MFVNFGCTNLLLLLKFAHTNTKKLSLCIHHRVHTRMRVHAFVRACVCLFYPSVVCFDDERPYPNTRAQVV